MGLLTSPGSAGSSKKLAGVLIKWEPLVSPLLYLGGVIWFLALAYHPYNAGTYFSENALLPGLVTNEFSDRGEINRLLESLQAEAEDHSDSVPHPWIRAKFRQLGLQVYGHNFTLRYPLGNGSVFHGENTYAVLRAPRSGSTEALVLSAPYRSPNGPHPQNNAALALLISLAKYFRHQVYWAKDIIFLVTEHEQLGAAAWLSAYHQQPVGHGLLLAGDLQGRAGSIQAAINLEVESPTISHVDVSVEGLNGQLPNLDLVKMAHWICHQEHVQHTIHERMDHPQPHTKSGYRYSLQTLLSMVVSQAAGTPTGNHGHYLRYGIQAVTLRARNDPSRPGHRSGLSHMARVLEGMFRSLNNLLERFHQSFFFYLMPATSRYISIGLYMPPFALIAAGIVLKALTCWLRLPDPADCQDQAADGPTRRGEDGDSQVGVGPVTSLLPLVLVPHVLGAVTLSGLAPLTRPLAAAGWPTEQAVFAGVLAASLSGLLLPLVSTRRTRLSLAAQQVLRCVALVELALLVFTAALFNISLALLVTTLYTPVALSARRYSSVPARLLASLALLLVHPFTLQLAAVTLGWLALGPAAAGWPLLLAADQRALTVALVDSLVYGARLLDVCCTVLLPVWLQFWGLVHCR